MSAHRWNRATWFKSSRSAVNGACVEVAVVGKAVGVRDSKTVDGPILEFRSEAWAAFVTAVRDGRLSR
jgi:hypothetical protein